MDQHSITRAFFKLGPRALGALLFGLATGSCDGSGNEPFDGYGWVPCAVQGEVCTFARADSNPVRVVYGKSPDEDDYNTEIEVANATSVPCENGSFGGNPNPITWETNLCWYWGQFDVSTPTAEQTHPRIDLPVTSPPFPGFTGPRVMPGPGQGDPGGPNPPGDGVSAFRELCGFSHFAFDDPIVYPGEPGRAHLHMFFGNTGINAFTTSASAQVSGNSTCAGGTLNRSAYWVPAMIDNRTHAPVRPISVNAYYKSGYQGVAAGNIHRVPVGLVMISGDANNTTAGVNRVRFMCDDANEVAVVPWQSTIPGCPSGGVLFMEIVFPQCWDGVNVDSANHKSHMAFGGTSGCPNTHPVAIPEIAYQVRFRVPSHHATLRWQLASDHYDVDALGAGISGHGDYMYGWNDATVDTFVQHCLNAGMDCHNYLLGNGTMLY